MSNLKEITIDQLTSAFDLHKQWVESGGEHGERLVLRGYEIYHSIELENQNLRLADFTGSEIDSLGFHNCVLDGASFSNCKLDVDVRFHDCSLTATSFTRARLGGTSFRGCGGKLTDFTWSHFMGAGMKYCCFESAVFPQAEFWDLSFEASAFVDCSFYKAIFESSETDFRNTVFQECDMRASFRFEPSTNAFTKITHKNYRTDDLVTDKGE